MVNFFVINQVSRAKYCFSDTCYKVYKFGEACASYDVEGNISYNGILDACVQYNMEKGNGFVVWYKGQCWGSKVCDTTYVLSDTISYDITSCTGI